MIIQGWFPLGLTGLISLQSKGLSRVFSSTTVQNHQFFGAQSSLWSSSHMHTWLLEKPICTFVGKVMSLLFNMLSRFVNQLSSRVCSNSCPLSQWCYLTISSSAICFSFCLQCSPASESFPMSQLFSSNKVLEVAISLAKVLALQLQQQSFQWIFGVDFL